MTLGGTQGVAQEGNLTVRLIPKTFAAIMRDYTGVDEEQFSRRRETLILIDSNEPTDPH